MTSSTRIGMRAVLGAWVAFALFVSGGARTSLAAEPPHRIAELDAFWKEISRTVREGDFAGYRATCHEDGVLVSGASRTASPLTLALARWKQGFLDTKAGKMKASVEFRFGRRWGDDTTAHESGIFRYSTIDAEGQRKDSYVHFEVLLVKKEGWKTLMEYQKSTATPTEWEQVGKAVTAER